MNSNPLFLLLAQWNLQEFWMTVPTLSPPTKVCSLSQSVSSFILFFLSFRSSMGKNINQYFFLNQLPICLCTLCACCASFVRSSFCVHITDLSFACCTDALRKVERNWHANRMILIISQSRI